VDLTSLPDDDGPAWARESVLPAGHSVPITVALVRLLNNPDKPLRESDVEALFE
jgi:hypothetical protein